MKKSLNAWTVEKGNDFDETFDKLERAGFHAVELNVDRDGAHALTMDTTKGELKQIKKKAAARGIEISGISTSLTAGMLGKSDDGSREYMKKLLRKQISCAAELEAGAILTVPGADVYRVPLGDSFDATVSLFDEMGKEIEESGVLVGLENVWNGYFTSPFDMTRMIDRIGNKCVGAYFDAGNVIAFSNPVRWIEVLGSRIVRVHIKGYKRNGGFNSSGSWCDLADASVDWKEIRDAFIKVGYDSYITGEVSPAKSYENIEDFYREVSGKIDAIIG